MGLDMVAYKCKTIKDDEWIEFAGWRNHNRLHGYMRNLWESKGSPDCLNVGFNGIPLELNADDLKILKTAIIDRKLPATVGCFFGEDSYKYDQEVSTKYDLQFVEDGLIAIQDGYKVIYDSGH